MEIRPFIYSVHRYLTTAMRLSLFRVKWGRNKEEEGKKRFRGILDNKGPGQELGRAKHVFPLNEISRHTAI